MTSSIVIDPYPHPLQSTTMPRLPSIASLMSPPEAMPHESFSPALKSTELPRSLSPGCHLPPIATLPSPKNTTMPILPSPPTSPPDLPTKPEHAEMGSAGARATLRDPILYPVGQAQAFLPASQPLFPSEPSIAITDEVADQAVSKHMSMHMAESNQKVHQPTREEYLLTISFLSTLGRSYNRNPGAYMKRTREETENHYWKAKRICADPGHRAERTLDLQITGEKADRPAKAAQRRPERIRKSAQRLAERALKNAQRMAEQPLEIAPRMAEQPLEIAPAPAKQPKRAIKPAPVVPHPPRAKRTPKPVKLRLTSPVLGRSATPDIRPPGTKRPEDVDFRALPDYSPPTSTLPKGNPKSLKADWPSPNVLNLANDPDRELLHEAELNLAATLRLSCATYLCSKFRIFAARLNALRIGKEFRKTDAQQACKIDVNKASKLWTAYDRVGWFDPSYFEQHL